MQGVRQLYDLQEIDLRLAELERSLSDVRAKLGDESVLAGAREHVAGLQAQLDDLTARRRTSERAVSQHQEALGRVESRLYGGAITSEREVSAAEEERSFVAAQRQEEEDVLLELMVGAEEVEAALSQAREELERIEADTPAEKAGLREEEERLTGEFARVGQSRDRLVPQLSAEPLALYESLRRSRNGQAVAKVERGMCASCRLTLSTMELQRARSARGVVQCSSCGRILYVV